MAFAVPAYLCHGVRLNDYSQPPVISGAATAVAHGFRRSLGGRPILFVHTDSKPEKNWPRDRFRRVIDTFLSENPDVVALVVDVHGQGIGRTRFPDRVLPVRLPLEECFALLRDSDLFLGVDSCHLHAADLFGVPGVGLFGPTTSRRWGYRFSKFRYLQGAGRIDAIQVDEVCDALRGLSEECILRRYPIPDVTS
jgi:ADP-heptose:LPS heptosyltransferase